MSDSHENAEEDDALLRQIIESVSAVDINSANTEGFNFYSRDDNSLASESFPEEFESSLLDVDKLLGDFPTDYLPKEPEIDFPSLANLYCIQFPSIDREVIEMVLESEEDEQKIYEILQNLHTATLDDNRRLQENMDEKVAFMYMDQETCDVAESQPQNATNLLHHSLSSPKSTGSQNDGQNRTDSRAHTSADNNCYLDDDYVIYDETGAKWEYNSDFDCYYKVASSGYPSTSTAAPGASSSSSSSHLVPRLQRGGFRSPAFGDGLHEYPPLISKSKKSHLRAAARFKRFNTNNPQLPTDRFADPLPQLTPEGAMYSVDPNPFIKVMQELTKSVGMPYKDYQRLMDDDDLDLMNTGANDSLAHTIKEMYDKGHTANEIRHNATQVLFSLCHAATFALHHVRVTVYNASKVFRDRGYLQLSRQLADESCRIYDRALYWKEKASRRVFNSLAAVQNNIVTCDLHGQLVDSAIDILDRQCRGLQLTGNHVTLKVIVGVGRHSKDDGPKLRGAVLTYIRGTGLSYKEEGGVVLVTIEPKG
mmetsp:Transcript_7330/g.14450  ORF Transcript_7330/g.14450 Transcript_7330/m.14450 type:complete len:536 (-) Transcript_7330:597-2204(-)